MQRQNENSLTKEILTLEPSESSILHYLKKAANDINANSSGFPFRVSLGNF